MDLYDDSREDRFIEDYLYKAYKTNPSYEAGQQFAKPIEDEDLFGLASDPTFSGIDVSSNDINRDLDGLDSDELVGDLLNSERPFKNILSEDTPPESSPGQLFDDEISGSPQPSATIFMRYSPRHETNKKSKTIDEILIDDSSHSISSRERPSNLVTYRSGEHNDTDLTEGDISSSKENQKQLTPLQKKKREIQENLLKQALDMSITPKKLKKETDNEFIEFTVERGPRSKIRDMLAKRTKSSNQTFVTPTKTANGEGANDKYTFDTNISPTLRKFLGSSKKSPEQFKSWQDYKDMLHKRICQRKRKAWDSLLVPSDEFDDEEKLISAASGDEDKAESSKSDEGDKAIVGSDESDAEVDHNGNDDSDDDQSHFSKHESGVSDEEEALGNFEVDGEDMDDEEKMASSEFEDDESV